MVNKNKSIRGIESFHNKLVDFLEKIHIEHILTIIMHVNLISFPFPHLLFLGLEKFPRVARRFDIRIFEQGLLHQPDVLRGVGSGIKFEIFYSVAINSRGFGNFSIYDGW